MAITITKPTVGGSEDTWGTTINTALDDIVDEINNNADGTNAVAPNLTEGSWEIGGTAVTATAQELNYMDGVTSNVQTQINAINSFPSGGIIMWSGTIGNIPSGWKLCDGTNGTPNLKDRFIVGSTSNSGQTHDIGDTGGANSRTLSASNIPSHTHSFSATTSSAGSHNHTGTTSTNGSHNHGNGEACDVTSEAMYGTKSGPTVSRVDQSQSESKNQQAITETAGSHNHTFTTSTASNHTHTVSGTTGAYGSGSAFDNRPAYYALAFIMKA